MAPREGDTALMAGTWPLGGLGNTHDTRVGHSTGRNMALGGIYGTGGHAWHPEGGHLVPGEDTALKGTWHPLGTRN